MPSSPFKSAFRLWECIYTSNSETYIINELTGNSTPVQTTKQITLTIKKDSGRQSKIFNSEGLKSEAIAVKGYLVKPLYAPSDWLVGTRVSVHPKTLNKAQQDANYWLSITSIFNSPIPEVTKALGSKYEGILTIENRSN